MKVLAVPGTDGPNERIKLFDLPAVTSRGETRASVACLSPGATRSIGQTQDQRGASIALYDLTTDQPLMRMVLDDLRSLRPEFSPDGRHVMFGRKDGTVSVLDLVEINKQLTKLDLGW